MMHRYTDPPRGMKYPCPGCGQDARFEGTTSDYRDPDTGYTGEPGTFLYCYKCGHKVWPDGDIFQAQQEQERRDRELEAEAEAKAERYLAKRADYYRRAREAS